MAIANLVLGIWVRSIDSPRTHVCEAGVTRKRSCCSESAGFSLSSSPSRRHVDDRIHGFKKAGRYCILFLIAPLVKDVFDSLEHGPHVGVIQRARTLCEGLTNIAHRSR